jgi:hypothetical protein
LLYTWLPFRPFSYLASPKLISGGNLNQIFNYDVHQNVVVTKAETTQGAAVVKFNGRFLCLGGTAGDISLHDPFSLQQQMVIPQVLPFQCFHLPEVI